MTEEIKPQVTQVEQPVQEPAITDKHTAENTTMKKRLPPESMVKKELTPEEIADGGYIPVRIGATKPTIEKQIKLTTAWLPYFGACRAHEEGSISDELFNKARGEWEAFCEENYPGIDPDDLEKHTASCMEFSTGLLDPVRLRSNMMMEEGVSNTSSRGAGYSSADIVGKTPVLKKANSVAETMIRASLSGSKDKLNFDVLLRDSFVMLTFTRPSKLEIGGLLQDIQQTVKGYVRSVRNNFISMARIAACKAIWDFMSKRIIYSSVSDLDTFDELTNVILFNDIERLAIALVESFNTRGVNLGLRCYDASCDWSSFSLVDPTKLVHNRDTPTDEEYAIFANLMNQRVRYTAKETLELSRSSQYGMKEEDFRIYNENKTMYLVTRQPTLAEAFNTFDNFIADINPKISDLRARIIDPEEFESELHYLYSGIGSTEYIHWIQEYHVVPSPDQDMEPISLYRKDEDEKDFDKGLVSVIGADEFLSRELVKQVTSKVPLMSHGFVGLQNFICPSCKQHQSTLQEKEGNSLGYTPIDAIMAFFTLTQLTREAMSKKAQEEEASALSN